MFCVCQRVACSGLAQLPDVSDPQRFANAAHSTRLFARLPSLVDRVAVRVGVSKRQLWLELRDQRLRCYAYEKTSGGGGGGDDESDSDDLPAVDLGAGTVDVDALMENAMMKELLTIDKESECGLGRVGCTPLTAVRSRGRQIQRSGGRV